MDLARHARPEWLGRSMPNSTPFFKAFGPLLFGRPARRTLQKIGRLNSLQELYELFGHLLPEQLLAASEKGVNSRDRLFSTQVTFWAFAAQILSPGTSQRAAGQETTTKKLPTPHQTTS
jgi:hypothetical protein